MNSVQTIGMASGIGSPAWSRPHHSDAISAATNPSLHWYGSKRTPERSQGE